MPYRKVLALAPLYVDSCKEVVMKYTICTVVTFVTCIVVFSATSAAASITDRSISSIVEQAKAAKIDTAATYAISGVLLEDGPMQLSLDSGTVVFFKPVAGRRVAALFTGAGSAAFNPATSVERRNVKRFYPEESFAEEITYAVIVFADTNVAAALEGTPTSLPKRGLADMVKMTSSALVYEDGTMDSDILRCLANGWNKSSMTIIAGGGPNQWECTMMASPFDAERYSLYITKVNNNIRDWVMASKCGAEGETIEARDDGMTSGDVVFTEAHTIVATFERDLDVAAVDKLRLRTLMDSIRIVDMDLLSDLRVDSVFLADGTRLTFTHPKDRGRFWIELPRSLPLGSVVDLVIHYHGEMIERFGDYTVLKTSIEWYPAHSYKQKSMFDLTFTFPDNMKLLSVGDLKESSDGDETKTSRWVTSQPIRNASFHIGLFKERKIETEKDVPTASMYYRTSDLAEPVAIDVSQALTFYTRLFGPLPIKHLHATELPGTHGEAFPGLLHLSSLAFLKADDFFAEQFLAHEVAHQWWGIEVDFASYRDQWLSEAFAEYSCLMYSQMASKERDKFFRLLEEYRKQIMSRGRRLIGSNRQPPSIALGYRVRSGGYSGDYNTYIYYKGAWVLHMLRNMLLNLQSMKEDEFLGTLSEFYSTYRRKRATTDDFVRVAEKHAKVELGWFFDQWVYGTDIPTYTYAWTKKRQADGTWKVRLRVKQSNVPATFRMYIPLKVVSTKDAVYRLRMLMTGETAEIDLPVFPDEPDELVFNDLSSVLCEVDEESFD
ncbi:MAG: M1 family metallopeptidase [Candidatus Kapabacteria bacterium]|nr:M1 family metallopeptidase [Candidatus Kapabacteria bacterium]